MVLLLQPIKTSSRGCDSQENGPKAVGQTILIADDNPSIRRLLRKLLEAKGHRVLCGSNGREALQLSRDFSGEVHLVITDVDMPEMNGIELSEHIRAERP